ncbi:hypothetical protein MFERI13461_00850 [Mycoplasma feriruminatoris]|uniref:lipoprotein n=1 Tax=Mycoplasma feriruminatoris TaxID=1179777 RepID=UPI00241EAE96|nr:lipoprotein [Mycoplasma feriruminatoris]WFQ91411.1 hypothetical protein MFERI13461_00850 [Mycoplasma feriruminatoris]
MKKLLTILGSVGLIATTSAAVVACGDRTAKTSQPKKEENKTEEPKKEERKEEKTEPKFSEVENKILANFQPNNKNMIPQGDIKKELVKKLGVSEQDLQGLKVNYEEKTGEVTLPRFDNKNLKFKFTSYLELGKIKTTKHGDKHFVSQAEIKKELVKKIGVSEQDLYQLNTDSSSNDGVGTVRSKTFVGTLEFKFQVEENKEK